MSGRHTLNGLRFRMTADAAALVFSVDRLRLGTVYFHASSEGRDARRLPAVEVRQRLTAGRLTALHGETMTPMGPDALADVLALLAPAVTAAPVQVPVRNAVVLALQGGPLAKWQIREATHEEEARITKALTALRRAGVVKRLGTNQTNQQWVLAGATGLAKAAPIAPDPPAPTNTPTQGTIGESRTTVVHAKPTVPQQDSWWTRHAAPDAEWSAFSTAASTRARELVQQAGGRRTDPT